MDDVYYLIHATSRSIKDNITRWKQLRTGYYIGEWNGGFAFPGVYCSIVHKYNIHKLFPFLSGFHHTIIILSKTLLMQKNFHINPSFNYGLINENTFFYWELDKFIEYEKKVGHNNKRYAIQNEVIFHDNIDLSKYACKFLHNEPFKHINRKNFPPPSLSFNSNDIQISNKSELLSSSIKYIKPDKSITPINHFKTNGFKIELPIKEYIKGEPDMSLLPCYLMLGEKNISYDFVNVFLQMIGMKPIDPKLYAENELINDVYGKNFIINTVRNMIIIEMINYYLTHRDKIKNKYLINYTKNPNYPQNILKNFDYDSNYNSESDIKNKLLKKYTLYKGKIKSITSSNPNNITKSKTRRKKSQR